MESNPSGIDKLAEALAKAQREIQNAAKDKANPYFKSKYADLASVWEACREPLTKNGLAVIQKARATEGGIEVETMLVHSSGQFVTETLSLPVVKADAQGIGSAITYARRYALSAMVGVAPEDDDGNAAADSVKNVFAQSMQVLEKAAKHGSDDLKRAWESITKEGREACKNELARLKKIAEAVQHREPGEEG